MSDARSSGTHVGNLHLCADQLYLHALLRASTVRNSASRRWSSPGRRAHRVLPSASNAWPSPCLGAAFAFRTADLPRFGPMRRLCGAPFTFTRGEQEFLCRQRVRRQAESLSRLLSCPQKSAFKWCLECLRGRRERQMFTATCSQCGGWPSDLPTAQRQAGRLRLLRVETIVPLSRSHPGRTGNFELRNRPR